MDNGSPILAVECVEPEGTFVRSVRPAQLSVESLKRYWERLKDYPSLFNEHVTDEFDFIETFVAGDGSGNVQATGLIWEVDDVGLLFITDITPSSAKAHFSFWDRRIRGRESLLLEALKYVFNRFGFHRITAEVPLYAAPWLARAVERIGFKKEGRMREVVRYKGQWFDAILYSILAHEVEDGISRTKGTADLTSDASR